MKVFSKAGVIKLLEREETRLGNRLREAKIASELASLQGSLLTVRKIKSIIIPSKVGA